MAKSPQPFTIFYAWQSDTPQTHCRRLIRDALDSFADAINADDEIPYRVNIDQDTQDVPGLCDIPATLLSKIDACDAFVADLTYVAKARRTGRPTKHCPNPNVLFELGYAFRGIGPERMVCVMNEVHGPRTAQIFDLAHRRHPIGFESPRTDGNTIATTRAELAALLDGALRPIVRRGPRVLSGHEELRHENERAQFASLAASSRSRRGTGATITYCVCPATYHERRLPVLDIESTLSRRAIISPTHRFPSFQTGTAPMPWGIYNDGYGDPWALTMAGQFCMKAGIAADYPSEKVGVHRLAILPEKPANDFFQPGEWIDFIPLIRGIYNTFKFAGSYSAELYPAEEIGLTVDAAGLAGKWLYHRRSSDFPLGPCVSPNYPRRFATTPAELQSQWRDWAKECCVELCRLFARSGLRIEPNDIESWFVAFDANRY
jgi:hypothetical protein